MPPHTLVCAFALLRQQGLSALWKGAVPTAGGMVFENCMAFGVNEALKRAFPDDPESKAKNGPPDLFKPFLMVSICIACLRRRKPNAGNK